MNLTPDPLDDDLDRLLAACGLKPPPVCGTVAAYMQHVRGKETPCGQCQAAFDATRANWPSKPRKRKPADHGTPAGARAHHARHEPACGPCARAYRAYQNEQRATRKARAAA